MCDRGCKEIFRVLAVIINLDLPLLTAFGFRFISISSEDQSMTADVPGTPVFRLADCNTDEFTGILQKFCFSPKGREKKN